NTEEYLTLKREACAVAGNQYTNVSNYQPSFNRSYQYNVSATHLIVNSTKIQRTSNPQDWKVDSAAMHILLHLQNNFIIIGNNQVKGFAGKAEIARGKGTMTLTDNADNRLTLKDIVYIPESPDQILSLIKLQREKPVDFRF